MKRFIISAFMFLTLICMVAGCGTETPSSPTSADQSDTAYQFKSDELQNYVIVYADENPDYYELAYRLNDRIYTNYGVILTTTRDTNSTPSQYEILLGDTNRDDPTGKVMEYSVTVEPGKFRINVGGSFSAEKAIDLLCEQLFNGQAFALDSGTYYQTSLMPGLQEVTESSSARIMSANLLADAFADASYRKASYRSEIFAGLLVAYTPDIVGLQEADESWNAMLDLYLEKLESTYGITYSRLLSTHGDKINYTSLLYRSDKYRAEISELQAFSWWTDPTFRHNYHMRNISWAQFSALDDTGKPFIVANTHWSYRTEHADGKTCLTGAAAPIAINELRTQCKDETNAFLSTLRHTYPEMPIFLTGDFNTSLSFFTDSDWTPAAFRIISEDAVSAGVALSRVPEAGHFDHLFGTGAYSVALYGFANDANYHTLLTDHPFVYADLFF